MITFTPQVKAAMITAGVLGIFGAAAVPMLKSAPASSSVSIAASQPASQPAANSGAAVPAADDLNDFVAVVSDDIKVHVLGVSPYPGDANSWWSAAGTPISKPNGNIPQIRFQINPPPTHQIVLRVEKPESVMARCSVIGAMSGISGFTNFNSTGGNKAGADISFIAFSPSPNASTVTLNVLISDGDWQTVVTDNKPGEEGDFDTKDHGKFNIEAVEELSPPNFGGNRVRVAGKRLPTVVVRHGAVVDPMQLVVVDDAGKIHRSVGGAQTALNGELQDSERFDLPLASIKQVLIQVRPFNKKLQVTDISVLPGQTTNPKAIISDVSPQDDRGGQSAVADPRTQNVIIIPAKGR